MPDHLRVVWADDEEEEEFGGVTATDLSELSDEDFYSLWERHAQVHAAEADLGAGFAKKIMKAPSLEDAQVFHKLLLESQDRMELLTKLDTFIQEVMVSRTEKHN